MKVRSIALATGLVMGSAAAVAATGPLDLRTGSAGSFPQPMSGRAGDAFTVTAPGTATAGLTGKVNGTQDIDFSPIVPAGSAGVLSFTQLLAGPAPANRVLATMSYTLTSIGLNGPATALDGGNLDMTAIPRLQNYALLLAGLAGVAFISRRRSN